MGEFALAALSSNAATQGLLVQRQKTPFKFKLEVGGEKRRKREEEKRRRERGQKVSSD